MKKVLSFVLVLAMVLGCFASVFAATFTDVTADDDFATAVDVLSDLGVVSGYTDGSYQPTKTVTRAEMASLLVKALGLTPSVATTTKFTDVQSADWFAGWVAYANSLGIIAGRSETIFDPKADVSYDEAIVMIINALGYAGSLTGTYPTAFIIKAQELGITEDVDLLGSAGANRGDIAQLIYNTLGCSIGTTDKDGKWTANADGDNMYKRLGGHNGAELLVTPAIIDKASADLSDYLGAKIIPVYNKDESKVIAVDSVKTTYVEGKLDSTGKKVGTTAAASAVTSLMSSAAFYMNGAKTTTAPTEAQLKAASYKYAVKFNDDDEIKEIVSIQWWKAEDDFQATADVKADATKIGTYSLPLKKDGKTVDTEAFELLGVDSIGEIKKDNVITVYKTEAGDVVKVEVGTEVVTGKISKVDNKENATINGTVYALADATMVGTVDETEEVELYMNYAGDVAFFKNTEAVAGENYAIAIAANFVESKDGWTSSDSATTRQVKLLLATGEEVVYDVYGDADTKHPATLALEFKESGNTAAAFMTAYGNTVITYTLKEGKLYEVTDAGLGTTSATEITKKASLDGKYFAETAVAFVKDEDGKYSVVTADKFAGMAIKNASYKLDDKGTIAVLKTDASANDADAVYGIFTGDMSYDIADKLYTLSFLVDGKPVDYESKADYSKVGIFGKVSFDGDYFKDLDDTAVTAIPATTGGAISANTYANKWALDAEAVVYVVTMDGSDVDSVKVGEAADLEDEDNTSIKLYDTSATPDKLYDVVVIYR